MSSLTGNPKPIVVALGGNALSPPSGDPSYGLERKIIRESAAELQRLAAAGHRLLIVHGNGPQVGRLMRNEHDGENLDVYVAQTQGELGYLLVQGLLQAGLENCVGLVTRTQVRADDPGLIKPTKAVGPILKEPPDGPCRRQGSGWRLLVGSPRPEAILELPAIAQLLVSHHVVAGGGGGIPVAEDGRPVSGVVDKDWVAALLAIELEAEELIFVTDVAGVYPTFDAAPGPVLSHLNLQQATALIDNGSVGAGSMAPKLESAISYTRSTCRTSRITALGAVQAALRNEAGTRITL